MNQIDFIGGGSVPKPFRDIRNTRPTVAEEKATLCLELGRLCSAVPPRVRNGSINLTREWVAVQKKARALVGNSRASVCELTAAITSMRRYTEAA